ncbi:MAG: hypothetical protein US62_C0003G0024 [Candidatus Woesebacteria bacterium GW2011_GWA1_37_8]|uniref:Glycosyltransferase RgtA/B/C/D-like domain-containing protein n=2 Tax=Candidatus Woeseibacteriota TaxID=1752722 RepID=A0A0G0L6V8_9BACT|nr:MAG: hypothetical protein US39_C0010G0023 [Microgenomates group bacterium GW2011_GWC1_37_12b]KKQ46275.1 MAG: hypothetical protein US62_C0003G0024 [Candidatus Woesebacteria bacterium GW2011_GWA1_37_8]KKQ87763.1 MAG: hypothetical protein UT10_C0001G0004 [Candidatus Woesebacteria bacterium GW2011_GWB1_38_8b]
MKKLTEIFLVVGILVFAGLIYLYKLDVIPSGFYVDEAVVAYNAYSILETGKDAFGQQYPVLFRLLGSYTPGLFVYTSALAIKLIGYQITTFRLLSAISALVSVVFFYLFIKKLKIYSSERSYVITTLFYAISPWLTFNARLGYEVTLAFTLFNIGVYFLLLALDKPKNYIYSFVFFSLATYTAHTQRFLVPIFCIFCLIIFRKIILKKSNFKYLFLAGVTTLLLQIPHLTVLNTPAFWVKNQRLIEGGRIIQNIINQTLSYLSNKNLFYELGDIDAQHTIPGISVMYNWMTLPFMVGLFILVSRIKERNIKFLLLLFVTSLIPAVLSGEFISIQRALPFLLPLMIVIGLGIDYFVKKLPVLSTMTLILLLPLSLLLLYRSYFVLFPIERSSGWNFGYDKLADYIRVNADKNYMVDNSRNPRNYILLLYHLKYPPEIYQGEVDPKYKTDYYHSLPPENSYKFSKIEVREISWETDPCKEQIIVGDPLTISDGQAKEHKLEKQFEIKDILGKPIYIGFKTNPQLKCKSVE